MEKRDYYDVLGVTRDASAKDIKTAYRKLAMRFHPDRNPGDDEAENKFKEAAEAYEVLSDEGQRKVYDRLGHEGLRGGGAGFSHNFTSVDEIFEQFGDIFGDFFGFGRQSAHSQQRGADVRIDLELEFQQAAFGISKTLQVPRDSECETCDGSGAADGSEPQTCSRCMGRGQVHHAQGFFTLTSTCPDCRGVGKIVADKCPDCYGTGTIREVREVQVNIPAGVDDGTRLRLRGEGENGRNGGPRGDLYVFLHVRQSEVFERDGADLHFRAVVSFPLAAVGGEIEVPTLEGKQKIPVAAGTQTGQQFVMRGFGVPKVNRSGRGNLFVHYVVETPRDLDDDAKELLRRFAELTDTPLEDVSLAPQGWTGAVPAEEESEAVSEGIDEESSVGLDEESSAAGLDEDSSEVGLDEESSEVESSEADDGTASPGEDTSEIPDPSGGPDRRRERSDSSKGEDHDDVQKPTPESRSRS